MVRLQCFFSVSQGGVIGQSPSKSSRRDILRGLCASAVAWPLRAFGDGSPLLVRTTGLEHVGMTVPDPEAAARFYGRLFDPQLFQERDPPPRFYVKVGIGYFAFGGGSQPPHIDHFCVLVSDYRPAEMRASLEAAGLPMTPGPFGMVLDPDGFRLQMLPAPGGLAKTIVPAFRISEDEPLFHAARPTHLVLRVSDLTRSVAHYRALFGPEARDVRSGRVWFAAGPTRIGLEQAPPGETPSIDHVAIRLAGFDRRSAEDSLRKTGIAPVRLPGENLLRFRDLNGLAIQLTGV